MQLMCKGTNKFAHLQKNRTFAPKFCNYGRNTGKMDD